MAIVVGYTGADLMNPFNGIERQAVEGGGRGARSTGIHSMELKGGKTRFYLRFYLRGNPFNGIESRLADIRRARHPRRP